MKNITLLLLLFSFLVNSQTVTIPDANFKVKLITLGIDTNLDGEIQSAEALIPTSLDIQNSSINDLTGIEAFINLSELNCAYNNITTLDISALANLTTLSAEYNLLTSFNPTSSNIKLKFVRVHHNSITFINTSNLPNLESLWCAFNTITSLNVSNNPNLKVLLCSNNSINTLNLDNNINLESLLCASNGLTQLNITSLVNLVNLDTSNNLLNNLDLNNQPILENLRCRGNLLVSLDVSSATNLNYLDLANNQISSLNLSTNPKLINLFYENNSITNLDISILIHLKQLSNSGNGITNLTLPSSIQLERINCALNPIVELNLSTQYSLNEIVCGDPALERVFIKNGNFDGDTFTFESNSPNLQFVCGDDDDIAYLSQLYPSIVFNTYCTFIPGGSYNTLSGSVRIDLANDGCDTFDFAASNVKVNLNDGRSNQTAIVNDQSLYSFFIGLGNYTVSPLLENPSYFNVSPTADTVSFSSVNSITQTKDFCLTTNGVHPDLEIVIIPSRRARPGFDEEYTIVYRNKGTVPATGTVILTFDDITVDFVSAIPAIDNQVTNELIWNYSNLQPLESRYIKIILNLNSPTETPPLNSGDFLTFSLSIDAPFVDELPEDNLFVLHQKVINSYDPNDKTCLEGTSISPSRIGDYLHYNINFENLGTAEAEKVVISDVIDISKYDLNSLQVLYSSHPMRTEVKNNTIEFLFDNINLAPAIGNPAEGGKGNVLFKIKTLSTLLEGDSVSNKANIFFDYNFPVPTNLETTIFQDLNIKDNVIENSITLFPNPTNDVITINSDFIIDSVALFDMQGRILETHLSNKNNISIAISSKNEGAYLLKINTEKGTVVKKIIKQ